MGVMANPTTFEKMMHVKKSPAIVSREERWLMSGASDRAQNRRRRPANPLFLNTLRWVGQWKRK
jgi:hypothetical protein